MKETKRIVRAAEAVRGIEGEERRERFAFEYPGSVQGFTVCPYVEYPKCTPKISNGNEIGAGNGLRLNFDILAEGMNAHVSVATFLDIHEEYRNYETYVSPTLYTGQTVTVRAGLSRGRAGYAPLYLVCRPEWAAAENGRGMDTVKFKGNGSRLEYAG